jgi:hypothetical protein
MGPSGVKVSATGKGLLIDGGNFHSTDASRDAGPTSNHAIHELTGVRDRQSGVLRRKNAIDP